MTQGGGGEGSEFYEKQNLIKKNQGSAWDKPYSFQRASSIIANHDQIC
jgi:hypothetical protein